MTRNEMDGPVANRSQDSRKPKLARAERASRRAARRPPPGSRPRAPAARPLAAALALALFCACPGDKEDLDILPTGVSEGTGSGGVVAKVEGETPPKSVKTVVVEEAQPFLRQEYLIKLIRKDPVAMEQAVSLVKKMLLFPGPSGEPRQISPGPADVSAIRKEVVGAVQRAKQHGRTRFLEDMETFAVFSAAFSAMNAREQEDLFQRWRDLIGVAEPARSVASYYPLFWFRESGPIWSLGGFPWWWGYHALAKDPAFSFDRESGARFETPEGTIYRSRRPR